MRGIAVIDHQGDIRNDRGKNLLGDWCPFYTEIPRRTLDFEHGAILATSGLLPRSILGIKGSQKNNLFRLLHDRQNHRTDPGSTLLDTWVGLPGQQTQVIFLGPAHTEARPGTNHGYSLGVKDVWVTEKWELIWLTMVAVRQLFPVLETKDRRHIE